MKKGILVIPVAGVVATVVALGALSIKDWKWENTASKKQINYCLLIGQTDHNDSAARTRGIREKLGTRPDKHETNPNVEVAKQGKLALTINGKEEEYLVNELETKVCISDTGATWDQATSINVCNTWYSKHQNNLTMIVSNNDGMAEGALFSSNRPTGMPIFGYDSNESTLNLILQDKITGTINSNAPAQAAAMNILASRILDGTYKGDESIIKETLFKGFYFDDGSGKKVEAKDNDLYVAPEDTSKGTKGFITDITHNKGLVSFTYKPECHALLVSSNDVTKDNAEDFKKSATDQANSIGIVSGKQTKKYSFFQSCYSKTDTYLTSTMNPLLTEFRKAYNIDDVDLTSMAYGNGNDEDEVLNKIETKDLFQAYIINMTKTINADKYIKKIKEKAGDKWKDIPIIFYNRQPTDKDNVVDPTWLLPSTNGGNPYVFYVGFDAEGGADLQGTMIQNWIKKVSGATDLKVK